ncbi:hypothetical protein MNBD_BACTEROID01-223 [hydrothermal vent metagenome]|uniref:Uncharacterized protein n=1 Tax=hydrothermal vent metagenome TaxID=652676 RepID=A0A3B0TUZ5_9ZZZZ
MWIIIWEIVLLFSIISFTYMSIKVLYLGIHELKEMFKILNGKK